MKQLIFSIQILLYSNFVLGTTHFDFNCPDQFLGKITKIENLSGLVFPKVEVSVTVLKSFKGNVVDSKKIQVIKGGPTEFVVGEKYKLETKENWLCTAEKIVE